MITLVLFFTTHNQKAQLLEDTSITKLRNSNHVLFGLSWTSFNSQGVVWALLKIFVAASSSPKVQSFCVEFITWNPRQSFQSFAILVRSRLIIFFLSVFLSSTIIFVFPYVQILHFARKDSNFPWYDTYTKKLEWSCRRLKMSSYAPESGTITIETILIDLLIFFLLLLLLSSFRSVVDCWYHACTLLQHEDCQGDNAQRWVEFQRSKLRPFWFGDKWKEDSETSNFG